MFSYRHLITTSPFLRLLLSHLSLLLLSTIACLYSIIELGSLSGNARTALDSNQRMIGYQEALTDAFLSQVRYGGKFLIRQTAGRHEQFDQFKKDFTDYLGLLKFHGGSEPVDTSLSKIERLHRQYHDLFEREEAYIRNRQTYAHSRYDQERNKIVESSIRELDGLKAQLRTDLHERLEGIERGARIARRIALATTLLVLFLGTVFSLKVSQSLAESQQGAANAAPVTASQPKLQGSNVRIQAFRRGQMHVGEKLGGLLRGSTAADWNGWAAATRFLQLKKLRAQRKVIRR